VISPRTSIWKSTCEGWSTGAGTLTYTPVIYPAFLEGDHSIAEDAVGALLLNVYRTL